MVRGIRWRTWLGLVPRDLDGFAALAQARLQELRGESSTWSSEQALLQVDGPHKRVIPLAPAFEAYRAAPRRARQDLLDRVLEPLPSLPDRHIALQNLLPAIRNRYLFANELRQAARHWTDAPAKIPPMRPIAEHLGLVLVHDEPETVSLLGQDQLSHLSIGFDEALEVASQNLRVLSDADWTELAPGLFASPWSDFHDAARLCLPDLFHRLPVRGQPVAAVPNRQTILVTGDHDVRALAALFEATRALLNEERPISGIPIRHDGQAWASWTPDTRYPELTGWSELRAREIGSAYELQRDLLSDENRHPSQNPSVIPVPVGDLIRTGCFWPSQGTPLIPAVDLVLFGDDKTGLRAVPLAAIREHLPHLLERTDAWPPRWRALRCPTTDELDNLESTRVHGVTV